MTDLDAALSTLGLSSSLAPLIGNYVGLFHKWNRHINLSAARTQAEILEHVVDSLHAIPHLLARPRILDVGAGGGLPSVLTAICLPDATVTALEPVHKKHAFLRAVARELALPNFVPLAARLEDHPHRDYDAATSRATFALREWLDRGLARVRPGGLVLGFEGISQPDLPLSAVRHQYAITGKSRSIITLLHAL